MAEGEADMIEKLVFWEHAVETLGYFSRQMEEYFKEQGYKTFFVDDKKKEESIRCLKKFIKAGRTAFITFNFIGLSGEECCSQPDGRSIWEAWNIPCYCIMVDHPFYYEKQLSGKKLNLTAFCVDRGHTAYVQRFYPNIPCHFLPLAGNMLILENAGKEETIPFPHSSDMELHMAADAYFGSIMSENIMPYRERRYDISFIANYVPLEELEVHIDGQTEEYVEFYYEIIEDLKRHPSQPVDETLEKYIKREIPEAGEEDIRSAQAGMMVVDLYIRSVYRSEVIRSLVEAGLTVHVFGSGWDKMECAHKENLIANGKMLTSAECVEIIQNSKIALNVMPWFKDGAHDRIFTAMLNGAVCLTDDSIYLREILSDGEDVCFYRLPETWIPPEIKGISGEVAGVAEMAKYLLEHQGEAEELTKRAYEKAKREHTWRKRAEWLERFWNG